MLRLDAGELAGFNCPSKAVQSRRTSAAANPANAEHAPAFAGHFQGA